MAEAVSPACAIEIVRKTRHRFGAAGEHAVEIAGCDLLVAECDRLHARGAGFIHRVGRDFLRNAAADRDLPRRIGASACRARVAEDGFFDLLRLDSGALECGFRCDYTEIDRRLRGERASELSDWRADGGENVHVVQRGLRTF